MTYDNGPICPHCGGQTHYYDKAKRIVKGKYGEVRKIYVYRYRCLQCGEIHRIIPDTLIPFKHYERCDRRNHNTRYTWIRGLSKRNDDAPVAKRRR